MIGGDISNVSSPQVIVTATLLLTLESEEEKRLLSKKKITRIGNVDLLVANKLWTLLFATSGIH